MQLPSSVCQYITADQHALVVAWWHNLNPKDQKELCELWSFELKPDPIQMMADRIYQTYFPHQDCSDERSEEDAFAQDQYEYWVNHECFGSEPQLLFTVGAECSAVRVGGTYNGLRYTVEFDSDEGAYVQILHPLSIIF